MCCLHYKASDPFVWLPTFNMTDGLKWLWNPDLLCHASEAWQLLWKVEVPTCPPAVCTLVPELMGNGHGYKSSSPVLPLLAGEASWLESLTSNHILERWICGLAVESPIWPVYMALKPMTTRIVSMSVFSIVHGNIYHICYFFSFFKVKKSKVHQSKECAMITFIFTTKIQQFLMFWHLCICLCFIWISNSQLWIILYSTLLGDIWQYQETF